MTSNVILDSLTPVDEFGVDDKIAEIIHSKESITVGFLNQHGFNLAHSNSNVYGDFSDIDYLLRDGKGIEIACRYYNIDPKVNMNGTDFIPKIISELDRSCHKTNFFAYGTTNPWLNKGASNLFKTNDFHSLDGFKCDDEYIKNFSSKESDKLNVVVLAMGMPKQERIAKKIKYIAKNRTIIICGGAILDFQSDRVERAPNVFQSHGFEWLYRLVREPKRLFSRYVIGIPVFFYKLFILKARR